MGALTAALRGSLRALTIMTTLICTTAVECDFGVASVHVIDMQRFLGFMPKSFHIDRASQGGTLAALLA